MAGLENSRPSVSIRDETLRLELFEARPYPFEYELSLNPVLEFSGLLLKLKIQRFSVKLHKITMLFSWCSKRVLYFNFTFLTNLEASHEGSKIEKYL